MSGFTRARGHRFALVSLVAASALLPATTRHTHAQTSGPIASYAFSEGTGLTTADASGNTNTATLSGSVAWGSGYFGNGVTFDATQSGSVQMPMSDSLAAMTNAFTLEAWVNPTDVSDYNPAIERRDGGLLLFLGLGGVPCIFATLDGNQYRVCAPAGIAINTWTHLGATYDGSAMRLYVNGRPVAIGAATGTLAATLEPFWIGQPWWGTFAGSLDEVRIYARALNAADLQLDRQTPVDSAAPFAVGVQTPSDHAVGVITTPISAGFSRALDASTLTTNTFELRNSANAVVPGSVTYSAAARMGTLTPSQALQPLNDYTLRVVGGSAGVTDANGNALAADVVWTFTAAAAATAPTAAYAFSEGTGTTTADGSGNGNTATLVGTASWGAGASGGGMMLDGAHGSLQVPMSESLAEMTNAFTLEAWVKPADVSDYNAVFERGDGSQLLFLAPGGAPTLMALLDGTWHQVIAPAPVPIDQWTHIAATADGATLRLYVSGVQVASSAAGGALPSTLLPFWIGRPWWGNYNGSLDEVRVYRTALGPEEIAADMIAPIDPPPVVPPPPLHVVATTPANGALGVLAVHITASFDRDVDAATLGAATFQLSVHHGASVAASVTYDAVTRIATLTPASALSLLRQYDVAVIGGDNGAKAADGAALASDVRWTFTTAADATTASLTLGFEDGDDTSTDDRSGNGNTGVFVGGATYAPGWFGDGLIFDGMDDELDVAASDTLTLTDAFTFETWIYPAANAGQVWSRRDASGSALSTLQIQPSGALQFTALTTAGAATLASTTAVPLNAWTHVAVTYDGAALRLFLNGAGVATRSASGPLVASTEPVRFGVGYAGVLDEIRIYRRALSAAEIATDIMTPIHAFRPFGSLSPTSGVLGQTITIAGGNFNAVQGTSIVTFNFVPVTVTSWTSSIITVTVPSVVTQNTQQVRVVVNGLQSNPATFTILPPPHINSLNIVASWVGQSIAIYGTSFGPSQGTSAVTFNGVTAAVTDWGSSAISATVPMGATTGPVVITVGGRTSNALTFAVVPHLTSSSPSAGAIGQPVAIAGTTFGAAQGSSTVTFNGTIANVTSWSATGITAIAPANAGGAEQIAVTAGGFISNSLSFWIDPLPAITALLPATGSPGQAVGISGSGFGNSQGSSSAAFNGVAATILSWNDSAIVAAVPSGPATGPVVVSVAGQTSNSKTFTVIPQTNTLTIAAQVTPDPSASGWYGSIPISIHFTCTDTAFAVTSCGPNAALWRDGANILVGGSATDTGGNQASLSFLANVDLEPPQLSVLSPAASALFPSGTTAVSISGTAIDALSGLQSVVCGNVPAVITGATYACAVTVSDGTNSVHIVATDNAGHATSKDTAIRVGDFPPSALTISPQKTTLAAGWGQQLAVTDDLGRPVSGGVWDVSDAVVAEIVMNNAAPEVHALAAGSATLMFTKNGLSATAVLTVLPAAETLPPGTALWELSPSPRGDYGGGITFPFQRGEVLRAAPTDTTAPSLFFVEHSLYDTTAYGDTTGNAWPTRIRATTADGRERWRYVPSTPARQVAVDDAGGLVLNLGRLEQYGYASSTQHTIQHLNQDGVTTWEYWPADPSTTISDMAIRPDGTAFIVENTPPHNSTPNWPYPPTFGAHATLVALDGSSGVPVGRWTLFNTASGPLIREDGSVVVATFRQGALSADQSLWLATVRSDTPGAALTHVNIDGLSEDYALGSCCLHFNLKAALATGTDRHHLIPDGHGGLLLPVGVQSYQWTMIYRIDDTNTVTGTVQINQGDVQVVVGDEAAWVLAQEPLKTYLGTPALVVAFDPVGMNVITSEELFYDTPNELGTYTAYGMTFDNYYEGPNLTLRYAKEGGGIVISGPRDGNTSAVTADLSAGWSPSTAGPTQVVNIALTRAADSAWPYPGGYGANVATTPGRGVYVKGHQIIYPFAYRHASIRIVPTHQESWLQDYEWGSVFQKAAGTTGPYFVTIGASSDQPVDGLCTFGTLTKGFNRDTDINNAITDLEKLISVDEDATIRQILQAHRGYQNDLPYNCFPLSTDNYYNSNSYISGLLNATHAPRPTFPLEELRLFPGWIKPVPADVFH